MIRCLIPGTLYYARSFRTTRPTKIFTRPTTLCLKHWSSTACFRRSHGLRNELPASCVVRSGLTRELGHIACLLVAWEQFHLLAPCSDLVAQLVGGSLVSGVASLLPTKQDTAHLLLRLTSRYSSSHHHRAHRQSQRI